jgi:enoyl-CoA hydratase
MLAAMTAGEPHILFETRGALGLVTLNRPRQLNALTHGMCIGLGRQLALWAEDPAVKAVAVRGAGPKAFCAGGDIRAVWESGRDHTSFAARFFADEYRLNAAIARFPKPYIALWAGIVMGGGAGISVHGRYRLADSSLVFAMPETGIGFIPDIGASFFLPRLPDRAGLYLALSGARIGQGDALALGLATDAVDAADHEALIGRLAEGESAQAAIGRFRRPPAPAALAAERHRIAILFSGTSVEAVLERLDREGSPFAAAAAASIRARSPTSLKLAFHAFHAGKSLSLEECLKMEYRAAMRLVGSSDFQEGVRAQLIDKDQHPAWNPAKLAAVDEARISAFFDNLGPRDLAFA